MTNREMEEKFRQIVDRDTTMDGREKEALLNLYVSALYEAELGYTNEMMMAATCKVSGAIEMMSYMGKIRDDEDLYMLLNEIEAFAYQVAEDWTRSPWFAGKEKR